MAVSLDELQTFVDNQLEIAIAVATKIRLGSLQESYHRSFAEKKAAISEIPRFSKLPVGFGEQAWSVMLFVDLRNSSRRADLHGPRATYLTMHTYLPTMAYLVGKCGGRVVNYRGDGLFASFGLDETGKKPDNLDESAEVVAAVDCGKAMIEAIDDVVEPALCDKNVPGDIRIGVGIDTGDVVITRIGLSTASEVTAYGSCVNNAAKFSDKGNAAVVISKRAWAIYPEGSGGKMDIGKALDGGGFKIKYPSDYRVIGPPKKRTIQMRRT